MAGFGTLVVLLYRRRGGNRQLHSARELYDFQLRLRLLCLTLHQNFDWTENTLFIEEIPDAADPKKTAFFLGGQDIIIDAAVSTISMRPLLVL